MSTARTSPPATPRGAGVTNGLEVVHGVEVAHDVPATSGLDVAYGVEVAGATAEERLADLQRSYDALARHAASLLNSATDAFVSMDRHGSVVGWNAQAERLFGWSAAEANGRDLADLLIPEELRHSHRAGLRRLVAGGSSALLGRVVEVEGLHRDGRRIPLQLTVWPTPLGDDTRFSAFLRDVSDRTAAGAALAASEQRFRTAFDTGPVAMAIADEDDRWVEVNPAFCALLGRSAPDLLGRRLVEMAHPDDVELAGAVQRRRRREGNSPSRGEIRLVRGDSSIAWALMSTAKLPGPSGEDDWTLTHLHDVSERKQAEIELARRATHDDLTGLPNRVLLLEKITAALGSARRSGRPGAVLFCDLDGFKLINDSRGHPVGDAVLQLVSRRLESVVRADDVVARLGGDEFVVLARDVTVHEATSLAQRVLDTLSQPVTAGGHDVFVTTSVGIATYDAGTALGIDAHDLLRDADSAMYAAKDSGRNQAVVFGAHLRRTAIRRSRAEQRLRSALSEGRIEVHYQPVIELATGDLVAFEALARLRDAHGALLGPADFIPVAEETGLVVPLGFAVLQRACSDLARWQLQQPTLRMSVNLAAAQVRDRHLTEDVGALLRAHGVTPGDIDLEITETALLHAGANGPDALRRLAELGVVLGVDDFGTGYASLAYVHDLPLRFIKIDRSFVRGLTNDRKASAIVAGVTRLAEELDVLCVAEGIETVEQRDELARRRVQYGQGYLFGAPMSSADVPALLPPLPAG